MTSDLFGEQPRAKGRKWRVMHSSKSVEHATPEDLFAALDEEFRFALDVAASAENARCDRFFTVDDNGLAQDWVTKPGTAAWCNPPYGRHRTPLWVVKAWAESRKGATVVMLIPASTSTSWWHDVVMEHADEVRFVRGRLVFGDAEASAPFESAIVVFRPPPCPPCREELLARLELATEALRAVLHLVPEGALARPLVDHALSRARGER